jgi:uncharacterized protein
MEHALLPNATTLLALALVSLAAGLIKGLSGFGAALVMAPFFGLLLGPHASVALIVLIHAFTSRQGSAAWRGQIHWPPILGLAVLAVGFDILCTHVVAQFDPDTLRRITGLLVMALAALHTWGIRWTHRGGAAPTLLAGAACGTFMSFAGLGGPPALYYFDGLVKDPARLRAHLLAFFMILFVATAGLLAVQGVLTPELCALALLLVPPFYLGNRLGEHGFQRLPSRHFKHFIGVILIGSGLSAWWL